MRLVALVALMGTAACASRSNQGTNMAQQPLPSFTVIAHRGGALEAPENTVAAVEHGVSVGADWQEIDVTLSRDGEVVVIHDDMLDRTTSGKGAVANLDAAELTALTAGNPVPTEGALASMGALGVSAPDFGDRFAGATVPTLADVLAVPGARLMIELKTHPRPEALASAVAKVIETRKAADRVVVGSFDLAALKAIHAVAPALPLVGIMANLDALDSMLELPLAYVAVSTAVALEAVWQVPEDVQVWTWTVYRPGDAAYLLREGVHGVITDVPAAVIGELR